MANLQAVRTVYQTVVDDVINGVREAFLDEGMDEQVLLELKQLWDSKLMQSKAVEPAAAPPTRPEPPPPAVQQSYPAHPAALRPNTHQQQQAQQQRQPQQQQQQQQQQVMQQQQMMQQQPQQRHPIPQQQQRQPIAQQLQQQRQPMQQQVLIQQIQPMPQQLQQAQRQPLQQQPQQSHLMAAVSRPMPPPAHVHPPPAHQGPIHRLPPSQQINLSGPSTFNPAHSMSASAAGAQQPTTFQFQLAPGVYQTSSNFVNAPIGQSGGMLQLLQQQQQPNQQQQQRVGQPIAYTISSLAAQGSDPNVKPQTIFQIDGLGDSSSEEEEDEEDDEQNDDNDEAPGEEEEPLNSGDDVSDTDPTEVFEAENVVVCQFDKINRSKNKWKFHLKDGIMNLNGKDYVFQKATGDAEW